MSDLDPAYDADFSPVDFIAANRRRTLGEAVAAIPDDPQQAARAYQLGRATGDSPALIYPDLENYEVQHKAALTSALLNNSTWLRQYLDGDPMRARLSADDWGNLDNLTSHLEGWRKPVRSVTGYWTNPDGPFSKAVSGFLEGFGQDPIGKWVTTVPFLRNDKTAQAIWAAAGSPVEGIFRLLSGAQRSVTETAHTLARDIYPDFLAGEANKYLPDWAQLGTSGQFARDIAGALEQEMNAQGVHGSATIFAQAAEYADAFRIARPWVERGVEPPIGLHPKIDKIKEQQNDLDLKALEEATAAAEASATRQRDPQSVADLVRIRDRGTIEVDGEAVVKLYGDKTPGVEDGILGWVPQIEEQLTLAREAGIGIKIPIADWLAYADKELLKTLHDDIRVRPGGITKNEAKLASEAEGPRPPPLPEAIPSFRGASALEPMLSVGDRKLQMERMLPKGETKFGPDAGFHDFQLLDERGTPVGYVNLSTPDGGKSLYVDMISGINGLGPRDFGPALMRDLLRQIKEAFPEAKSLTGHRVSGAREKAGTFMEDSASPVIKLDVQDPKALNAFQELLEGGQWDTYSPLTRGYIIPDPLRGAADRELHNIILDELDRIVPKKVGVSIADTIEVTGRIAGQREGEKIRVGGTYIPFRDSYPLIAVALDSNNALTSARHEAIHHLRQYGFFTKQEWEILEAQALAGGWLREYQVDRRYPTASPNLKLEEAIAEAYPHWVEGRLKNLPPEVNTLFERLKAFFEAIKERIGKLLGKEPTWEDIFAKVDTGEIGRREGKPLDPRAFDEKLQVEPLPEGYTIEFRPVPAHMMDMQNQYRKLNIKNAEGHNAVELTLAPFRDGFHVQHIVNNTRWMGKHQGGLGELGYVEAAKALTTEGKKLYVGASNETSSLAKRAHERLEQQGFASAPINDYGVREIYPEPRLALDEKLSVEPPADPARVFQRAAALGMTVDQYKRYERLIEKRHAEDVAAAEKRISEAQRRMQTKEWKENRKTLRAQVAEEINLRPDIAADNYFADGILYGEKVERIRLGTGFLTEEQRAALPRDYYIKAGVHPDELAPLFGFPDGASLVEYLSTLSTVRRQSGMRPIEFKRRLIDIETDRQMQIKHGVLEDNILDAVKEQVASETQLNLLHEETLYYGIKSGHEPAFDVAQIKQAVADEFDRSASTSVSSDRYLAAAGRAGRAVENALLKGDAEGAFRAKQQQFYATLLARNAAEFETKVGKFEKLSARLSQREVKAIEPEYLDFIHELLGEAGAKVKRNPNEIESSKEHYGNVSLADFVNRPDNIGYDLDKIVSEDLQAGKVKPFDEMTVAEMNDFMDAVTALNHVGRKVRQIEIAGEKADWANFREKVISTIQELPALTREQQAGGLGKLLRAFDAPLTRMEEIVKDLDLRQELGPLHQAVIEPMMRSKAKEFDMMTDLSKHFQETRGKFDRAWRKSLNDTIDQDLLVDPYTGTPYDMTRENLIQIMLNWGNRSNIRKFVQGAAVAKWGRRLDRDEFPIFEQQIKDLIDKHARAEDWQFVRRMWEPFKRWESDMVAVSRNTTGVAPKLIEMTPVETPFGTFDGGYWPVKYDRLGSNAAVVADRKPTTDGVFGGDYFRAATAKGYLKERTGYVDFVDISTSLEQAAGTMQQTIHDIAFRDSLIQAGRVFYDKGIRAAIRKHYGIEYEKQLVPWLRRIANQFTADDSGIAGYNDFLRRVRINLVGHALPLNLKVILSPDIGVPDPRAWTNFLANRAENVKFAMEKSDEIRHMVYNMDRDFRESLDRVTLDPTIGDLQKKAVQWGFKPIMSVSQEFRMSTFVDQYHKALARGKTEQEAALIADSFVRERHGAASVVDLPAVMQSNEAMKMLTMFYGFFNTMYNWQRQLPGNVRRGEWDKFGVNALGSVVVGAAFGALLFNQRKEEDSWFKIIGKALLLQPLSTVPFVREAASYTFEGFQPRTPYASLLGAAGSIISDTKKAYRGERIEKPITHAANVVGLSTGLPLAQLGRTGQFAADVAAGQQRPKNIIEWARGIITGEAQLKR